ncbi:MAG: rRNA pseudouridine synthase [Firmicutes bacterium]|nr:rRNA pseudouridine synthase [Bacillota bacterium]
MDQAEPIRLQKFLAERGVASRRAAEQMIAAGRVQVNGKTVTDMGVKIVPERDRVLVDGAEPPAPPQLRYILLHKPTGYICSVRDEKGRRTVLDLVPAAQRLYPVGRLDYDTSGLLLLTNDGALTHALLHPSRQVEKTYWAETEAVPDESGLQRLRRGVYLSDGKTAPAKARIVKRLPDGAVVELTIHEGRNRQVRRMMEAINCPVRRLKRVSVAFLTLEGLPLGGWRELSPEEVARLSAYVRQETPKRR